MCLGPLIREEATGGRLGRERKARQSDGQRQRKRGQRRGGRENQAKEREAG